MEAEEKRELSHEPMPVYIPVFWAAVVIALFYLFLVVFKIIS
jgi:hypothetical protein